MSGILDSKSRVIDTVITTEGRRQLSEGGIDIKYVSFTDGATHYRPDVDTGSEDATRRLYLEACQLPQDDIIFRADGTGGLMPFRNGEGISLAGGRILQYTFAPATGSIVEGATQTSTTLYGNEFIDKADQVLASTVDNLRKMYLIATKDPIFEDDGFAVGPEEITFTIHNERPVPGLDRHTTHISALDSIFSDPRFARQQNFKYLPPVNKTSDRSLDRSATGEMSRHMLGRYSPWGRTPGSELSYRSVMGELEHYKRMGYEQVVNFDPTSRDNQLVGQFFERGFNSVKKLDVVDYGKHPTGDPNSPVAHIFFVGKVEVDERGTDTFIHLFTLVFE